MDNFNQTIASVAEAFDTATRTTQHMAVAFEDALLGPFQRLVEQGTETIGQIATPIAENPVVQFATKVPGLKWLMAALGQVDIAEVQKYVEALRLKHPTETSEELANRVIQETAMSGGSIGLVTNFVPPLALGLFAIDLAAVSALQAEMIYKIAAVYGFSLNEPSRRGEALAIYGLSFGGSGVIKGGLSIIETLPGVGMLIGATSNATLLFSLGQIANRFYFRKAQREFATPMSV